MEVDSPYCTPEVNITLYVNGPGIKIKEELEESLVKHGGVREPKR